MKIVKTGDKPKQQHGTVQEKVFANKNQVVLIEYDPKHIPVIRVFSGV